MSSSLFFLNRNNQVQKVFTVRSGEEIVHDQYVAVVVAFDGIVTDNDIVCRKIFKILWASGDHRFIEGIHRNTLIVIGD